MGISRRFTTPKVQHYGNITKVQNPEGSKFRRFKTPKVQNPESIVKLIFTAFSLILLDIINALYLLVSCMGGEYMLHPLHVLT